MKNAPHGHGLKMTVMIPWAAILVLALSAVSYALHAGALLAFPFDLDPGEGFDVYAAVVLLAGGDLYANPERFPYFAANYPPVYGLTLAPLVAALGPSVGVGRFVSIAAAFATAFVIYRAVLDVTGTRSGAVVGGLAFLASGYVYHATPLARVTSLMLFLGVAGMYCLERGTVQAEPVEASRRPSTSSERAAPPRAWLALGLALVLAAVYTKPVALDAAAAAAAYLGLRRPDGWVRATTAFVLAGVVLHLALNAVSNGGYAAAVYVSNSYPLDWTQAASFTRNFLETHGLLFALGLAGVAAGLLRGEVSIWALYLGAGLITAAASARWGAGESYFFPLIVSSCVLAGRTLPTRPPVRIPMLVALGLYPFLAGPGPWPVSAVTRSLDRGFQAELGYEPSAQDLARSHEAAAFVASAPGPVLSEGASFVFFGGGQLVGNPMLLRGLYLHGLYDPSELVRRLNDRSLPAVVLHGHWYPQPVLEAIRANYDTVGRLELNRGTYLLLRPS